MSEKRIGSLCVLVLVVLFLAAAKAPAQCWVEFVAREGGSITNPGEGNYNLPCNTWTDVEATPDPDYVFVRWYSSDYHVDIDDNYANPTKIRPNDSLLRPRIYAYFAPAHSTITISSGPGGSVTSPGEGSFTYDYDDTVTVVAEADPCYRFKRWWFNGSQALGNPYVFTVSGDRYIEAQFEPLGPYTLDVSSTTGGSVVSPSEGMFGYDCGTQVTLEAEAEPGYHFNYWSGRYNTSDNPLTITVDGDCELRANFAPDEPDAQQTFSLTISSSQGGSVTVPGEGEFDYDPNTEVAITATPDTDYSFTHWSGTAAVAGKVADPYSAGTTVLMDADYTLVANFQGADEPVIPEQGVLYVNSEAQPGEQADGSAAHPFDTIQEAIDAARDGDTVLVMPGHYIGSLDLQGKAILVTSLLGTNHTSYDAFGALGQMALTSATAQDDELGAIDWTLLDGDCLGPVVEFDDGEGPDCVLQGFTITGGCARSGGAILLDNSGPTIRNCLIVGNRATRYGGAVDAYRSDACFINCTFCGNYAEGMGGAVSCERSDDRYINCIFWDNTPDNFDVGTGLDPELLYCDVQGGWPGDTILNTDPCFVDPGYWANPSNLDEPVTPDTDDAVWVLGDHHLLSGAGRYDLQTDTWVTDSVGSPCIDAGDPSNSYAQEPAPNGDCINMGAYGGTVEASKTRPMLGVLYAFDLDTDPGWATEGQWVYGPPQGTGGANGNPDPSSGYTGANVYGVNLAGDYVTAEGGPYSVTAGPLDCSGQTHVTMRFARWLNSDSARFIRNAVEASNDGSTWQVIWESSRDSDITDATWQTLEYNLSAVAADESAVWIRWTYTILDRAYPYSGWNIDDIEIWANLGNGDPNDHPEALGARSPYPSVGAADVPTEVTLSWTPTGQPDAFDVYLGTSSDALDPMTADTDVNECPVHSLAYNTTYSWRVDAKQGATVVRGPVWHFTTVGAPQGPGTLVTIFDTYPVNLTRGTVVGTSSVCQEFEPAYQFVVESVTYQLRRITVNGKSYHQEGGVILHLYTDEGGMPGTELASWGPYSLGSPASDLSVDTPAGPVLQAETPYWLGMTADPASSHHNWSQSMSSTGQRAYRHQEHPAWQADSNVAFAAMRLEGIRQ